MYFLNPKSVVVIGLYLENVKNRRKLIEVALKVENPLLALSSAALVKGLRLPCRIPQASQIMIPCSRRLAYRLGAFV